MSDFRARGGDNSDTLYWQTASEQDNLGFNIERRIKPAFFDSLMKALPSMADSGITNAGRLAKMNRLSWVDTAWRQVNDKIIPGAPQGVSYGVRRYKHIDYRALNDLCYEYRLAAVDYEAKTKWYGPVEARPHEVFPLAFALYTNFPNPFVRTTTIRFDVPVATKLELNIYNLQGRLVRRLIRPVKFQPGFHRVIWNGKDEFDHAIAVGPYIYQLKAQGFEKSKMMFMVR
jgi:hypothetical protein